MRILKEAGMTAKRSKWDFARDGTSFLVKVFLTFALTRMKPELSVEQLSLLLFLN